MEFRDGVDGSPYTVFVADKAAACRMNLHVRNLPIYDYREALRPSTRMHPAEHEDFEEETRHRIYSNPTFSSARNGRWSDAIIDFRVRGISMPAISTSPS